MGQRINHKRTDNNEPFNIKSIKPHFSTSKRLKIGLMKILEERIKWEGEQKLKENSIRSL
jgi:hypothetical protein